MKSNSQSIKYWMSEIEKRISIIQKNKKIVIKKIKIEIKTRNKFYIWLKCEIEKKIQFSKMT